MMADMVEICGVCDGTGKLLDDLCPLCDGCPEEAAQEEVAAKELPSERGSVGRQRRRGKKTRASKQEDGGARGLEPTEPPQAGEAQMPVQEELRQEVARNANAATGSRDGDTAEEVTAMATPEQTRAANGRQKRQRAVPAQRSAGSGNSDENPQPVPTQQSRRSQQRAAAANASAAAQAMQSATQPARTRAQGGGPRQPVQRPPQATPRQNSDVQEQHAFLDAAKNNNFSRVRSMVLAKPNLINCQPAGRWTALHQAAQFGDASAIDFLLAHGASAQARTMDGMTPLEVAQPSVVELLIEATFLSIDAPNASSTERSHSVVSEDIIRGLPTSTFKGDASIVADTDDDTKTQCYICLADYLEGDELRELQCSHAFHTCCVDAWLMEKSSSCPICRHEVA